MDEAPFEVTSNSDHIPRVVVDEYDDDDKFIRSYEYSDPNKSTEDTLCSKDEELGIIVVLNTRDEHGHLNNASSPAHLHISTGSIKNEIGEININGSCPKTPESVVIYRTKQLDRLKKLRPNIVKWANTVKLQKKNNKTQSNWDYAQWLWDDYDKKGVFK
jgi:hypothetical protein